MRYEIKIIWQLIQPIIFQDICYQRNLEEKKVLTNVTSPNEWRRHGDNLLYIRDERHVKRRVESLRNMEIINISN